MIAGGALLWGVVRQSLIGYLNWRRRRAFLPDAVRNSGFVTDGRLRLAERTVLTLFFAHTAALLAFIVWFVLATNSLLPW